MLWRQTVLQAPNTGRPEQLHTSNISELLQTTDDTLDPPSPTSSTEAGWLDTTGRGEPLQTSGAREWLETQGEKSWLQTLGVREWLQTQEGKDWLQTQAGKYWFQTLGGREWLRTTSGREWLGTDGREWLKTPGGKYWLRSPGGQDLPDFLMFPAFLALRHQGHPAFISMYDRPLPDMGTIHAMTTLIDFANQALEQKAYPYTRVFLDS
ncbi:hypothetical protein BDR03DRAFT_962416 [Suillus americanus]|nr:hypothetical protein BDR03DRAFT_962416 [Suillus americanus]